MPAQNGETNKKTQGSIVWSDKIVPIINSNGDSPSDSGLNKMDLKDQILALDKQRPQPTNLTNPKPAERLF